MKSVEEIAGFPAGDGLYSNTGHGIHDLIRIAMLEGFSQGCEASKKVITGHLLSDIQNIGRLQSSKKPEDFQ